MKRKIVVKREKIIWFLLLALALAALALTFIPMGKSSAPAPTPIATGVATAEPATSPEPTVPIEPTASPEPAGPCTEPEPVPIPTRDIRGTPIPPPIGAGGVFKIEAAPCTRELALRDFAKIYRFWSNVDGNPLPRYNDRWNYFVQGQPAGEMWGFNTRYYAENKAEYGVWDPRGYRAEAMKALYQDPTGTTVWVLYLKSATGEFRRIADDALVETYQVREPLMRWVLRWDGRQYKAVSYEKISGP